MSDGTHIEWTDATVNAVNGCSVVSPGCTNCYAMRLAGTRLRNHPSRAGLTMPTKAGPVWTGEVRLNEKALLEPLRWRRPRTIFWNAHGDLFHPKVPDAWIDRQFAAMAVTPHHIHQVLTKRGDRMRAYFTSLPNRDDFIREAARANGSTLLTCRDAAAAARGGMENLPHIWLGVSVEDQTRADERIPDLLATPAAVRFLSCEPLLGPVDLTRINEKLPPTGGPPVPSPRLDALTGRRMLLNNITFERRPVGEATGKVDWVICGGESGPGSRPMHPDWARSLRDQCAAPEVAFFFKQFGEWAPDCFCDRPRPHREIRRPEPGKPGCMFRCGKKAAGRLLDGVQHDGMPA